MALCKVALEPHFILNFTNNWGSPTHDMADTVGVNIDGPTRINGAALKPQEGQDINRFRPTGWQFDTRRLMGQKPSSEALPTTNNGVSKTPRASIDVINNARRLLNSQQAELPRLPIPPLDQTADRLLDTLRPLTNDEHEYEEVEKLVRNFLRDGLEGEKYQQHLIDKAKDVDNWLTDWWLDAAYLENRSPCAVHVNPGIIGPVQPFNDQDSQLRYAAKLLSGLLDYIQKLDDGTVVKDKMGGKTLCMSQYYKIIRSCRIPGAKTDKVFNPSVGLSATARHIVCMHNNHIFSVDVYGADDCLLNREQLYEQLKHVVKHSSKPGPELGVMTTEHRDQWSKTYKEMTQDSKNRANFKKIQTSIIVLCLDKAVPADGKIEKEDLNYHQMNNGVSTKYNACNRWFDKILQIIVSKDGVIGSNYEHSTAEGPPVISIMDHSIKLAEKADFVEQPASGITKPTHLKFNLSPNVLESIEVAKQKMDKLIDDLELKSYSFTEFGKDTIKSLKVSPDAFIQVALQLAYDRLHGQAVATYESGSLRMFLEGRTDTIRSCSIASKAYCAAMQDPSTPPAEKGRLLKEAIQSHRVYTGATIQGQAIDRHLLGLKLAAVDMGDPVPDLFNNPIYQKGSHWTLSTSQVPSETGNMCYGPAVPEGYGFCYNPKDGCINFVFSAWNSCGETSCCRLADSMRQALIDGRDTMMQDKETKM